MTKLNWRNAGLASKRSLSISDEAEHRNQDAASRWLGRKADFMAAAAKKRDKRKSKKSRRATPSQPTPIQESAA